MTQLDRYVDWIVLEAGIRLTKHRDDGACEDWAELLPYIRQTVFDAVATLLFDKDVDIDIEFAVTAYDKMRAKVDAVDRERNAKTEEWLRYLTGENPTSQDKV